MVSPRFHALLVSLLASPAAAQYVVDNSVLPGGSANNSTTENVDFADVDLDGDWDVAMGDGGDNGNDQNRLWINQGGLQAGTLGQFVDETSAQFPTLSDDSRDIEFVDFDNDGDADIYISNTAQIANQGNRWWTNLGGEQAGTVGFYADETTARWIGLGTAGSSIPSNLVISGTFIDWSCDCDFGDLDNDGDLDLVHSTYGGAFGGQVPTRLFLNDGDGVFEEFNPGGFQLTGSTISNGNPGLWCDGNQSSNTTNSTGASCDIASSALDIDLGDIDGDFDLDILHGARQEAPRMFANRLDGSSIAPAVGGGALGFRDVTGAVFPSGYQSGNGHYEQEMGDLDGDGDLDIYGLNWRVQFGFNDITLRNDGSGTYSNLVTLSGSSADDNEGDFVDYDNDGDLDLFVANFSGGDKLYRNNNNGGATFSYTQVTAPSYTATSLDADACDTDGDGDYDILIAEDNFQANTFLRNTTEIPDTTAPYVPNVEAVASGAAAGGEHVVRAHVYDNAPYYITWYNPTQLEVSVGAVDLPDQTMLSSAGQVFRGTIPRNLIGTISYRVRSEDEFGNSGVSATLSYTSTGSAGTTYGASTAGSLGTPTLETLSLPLGDETLYLAARNMPPGTNCFIALSTKQQAITLDLSNGLLLHVGLPIVLLTPLVADANGDAVLAVKLPAGISGMDIFGQAVSLDGTGGNTFATSLGLELQVP
ncbi:MAG: VCBS repeat-containing protein [Planctomycetota bacterium]